MRALPHTEAIDRRLIVERKPHKRDEIADDAQRAHLGHPLSPASQRLTGQFLGGDLAITGSDNLGDRRRPFRSVPACAKRSGLTDPRPFGEVLDALPARLQVSIELHVSASIKLENTAQWRT